MFTKGNTRYLVVAVTALAGPRLARRRLVRRQLAADENRRHSTLPASTWREIVSCREPLGLGLLERTGGAAVEPGRVGVVSSPALDVACAIQA